MNPNLAARTVADLVTEDYGRAAVFKRFGIDFCCGGDIPLADACTKRKVQLQDVVRALLAAEQRAAGGQPRVDGWSPSFLADYIVNQHHTYVRESIPVLRAFTTKVARVHGHAHPELVEIANLFEVVANEMEAHMVMEEQAVFPAIRRLTTASGDGGPAADPHVDLAALVEAMEDEHESAGTLMRRIREASSNYTPPEYACNTYRASFAKLEEFEDDLHRHVHLENNVLFPSALAIAAQTEAA